MGRQHVSAGAHRGQPPERGKTQDEVFWLKKKDDDVLMRRTLKHMFCSPGQKDTGADPCEAAG